MNTAWNNTAGASQAQKFFRRCGNKKKFDNHRRIFSASNCLTKTRLKLEV